MFSIAQGLFRRAALCSVLLLVTASLSACCTGPTHTNPPPPPPPPPSGPPILCVWVLSGTFAAIAPNGASVSLNVPQPPPEPPGIKHNVQVGGTNYAGWCTSSNATSIDITPASGNAGSPPIAVWLLTRGSGSDIHVQDDGLHSGTPTPNLNNDLVPQP